MLLKNMSGVLLNINPVVEHTFEGPSTFVYVGGFHIARHISKMDRVCMDRPLKGIY